MVSHLGVVHVYDDIYHLSATILYTHTYTNFTLSLSLSPCTVEYTRVSLHPVEGVDGSDYINANYIMVSRTHVRHSQPHTHTHTHTHAHAHVYRPIGWVGCIHDCIMLIA